MRIGTALVLGLSSSIIVFSILVYALPVGDDFGLDNPYWNGLSDFKALINPVLLQGFDPPLEGVASRSVLFIIGPSKPILESEVSAVKEFLEAGGTVVLMDDYGSGNRLLIGLGVEARFNGGLLRDPLFRDRDSRLVLVVDFKDSPYLSEVSALTMNYATVISGIEDSHVLAYSTPYSYLDEDGDGRAGEGEALGPLPVVAQLDYGDGTLILISDSSLFVNGMLHARDNLELLKSLTVYRIVLLNGSHWSRSSLTVLRDYMGEAYRLMGAGEVKYPLAAILTALIFKVRWRGRVERRDEFKEVFEAHPNWDENILSRIKELRDRFEVGKGG